MSKTITKCKNCSRDIEQSPIGRERMFCSRSCGWRYRKDLSTGQGRLDLMQIDMDNIEVRLTRTTGDYNLPVHLMFERGPVMVLPAPANR